MELLWIQMLQITIAIGLVGLLHRLVANRQPHLICALWIVVLIKCLTPPILVSPTGLFCWARSSERQMVSPSEHALAVLDKQPEAWVEDLNVSSSFSKHDRSARSISDSAFRTALHNDAKEMRHANLDSRSIEKKSGFNTIDNAKESSDGQSVWRKRGTFLLVFGWVFGGLLFGGKQLRRIYRASRRIHEHRINLLPLWREQFEQVCVDLKVRSHPELVVTSADIGPLVLGLWRTRVVVPASLMSNREPAFCQSILGHELMHVRRGDLWLCRLQLLASVVWWFHPLVHWAGRRLIESMETCCDENVVASLQLSPTRYARHLLDVLESKSQLGSVSFVPGVHAWDVTSQRLERTMNLGQGCRMRTPWWSWVTAGIVATLIVPGGAMLVGQEDEPAGSPKNSPPRVHVQHDNSPWWPVSQESAKLPEPSLSSRKFDLGPALDRVIAEGTCANRAEAIKVVRETIVPADVVPRNAVTMEAEWLSVVAQDTEIVGIARALESIERYGLRTVYLEIKLITGQGYELSKLCKEWEAVELDAPKGLVADRDNRLEKRAHPVDRQSTSVRRVVEEAVTMRRKIVKADDVDAFLKQLDRAKLNLLQVPRVSVYNGRTASVTDSAIRFFREASDGAPAIELAGPNAANRPGVHKIECGLAIAVCPELSQDDSILLSGKFSVATMLQREEANREDRPDQLDSADIVSRRLPSVVRTVVETSAEVPVGGLFAISGFDAESSRGDRQEMMILVRFLEQPGELVP